MAAEVSLTVSPLYVKLSNREYRLGEQGTLRLRSFQAELLDLLKDFNSKVVSLLVAPTGSGKTLSLLLPLLANLESESWFYHGATGIYPSRELVEDQMVSLESALLRFGARPASVGEVVGELKLDDVGAEKLERYVRCLKVVFNGEELPVVLLAVTSSSLRCLRDVVGKHVGHEVSRSNLRMLEWLWNSIRVKAYRVVFTVPEYPYLLASTAFRDFSSAGLWLYRVLEDMVKFLRSRGDQEKLGAWLTELEDRVSRRRIFDEYYVSRGFVNELSDAFLLFRTPAFFDEFHLYSGPSLASFASLLYVYLLSGVGKVIVSSATPERYVATARGTRDVVELVRTLAEVCGYRFAEIRAEVASAPADGFTQIRKRTVARFLFRAVTCRSEECYKGRASFGIVQREAPKVVRELGWTSKYKDKERAMVLVDRVATAIDVAKTLQNLGEAPALVTSLGDLLPEFRGYGSLKKAKLVVGTLAIAYGIDVEGVDLGLIGAKDYASAIQKVGRLGRGSGDGVAEVYILVPLYILGSKVGKYLLDLERRGQEIPYFGEGGFVELLRKVFPRLTADPLLRTPPLVLKAVLPAWVYALASIIRERSEKRAEVEAVALTGEIGAMKEFKSFLNYVDVLEHFLGVRDLGEGLAAFAAKRLYLTPLGLYHFFSFRSATGVPVRRVTSGGDVVDEVSLVVAGRNIPLKYVNGELLYDDSRNLCDYFELWVGIGEDRAEEVKSMLRSLEGWVLSFRLVAELLGGHNSPLMQADRRVCLLHDLAEGELGELPVVVLPEGFRGIGELVALGEAIPIYAANGRKKASLLGALQVV